MVSPFAKLDSKSLLTWLCLVFLTGCTVNPPAQEMSNARQSIQAAKEAKADAFSPAMLQEAQQLLEKATLALEKGDYTGARHFAVSAQKLAIQAHHQAISQQGRE